VPAKVKEQSADRGKCGKPAKYDACYGACGKGAS